MTSSSKLFMAVALAGAIASAARPAAAQAVDLTKLTLEDLLSVEVTSVSKKEQPLSRTAAAVYVITQEDVRRSGATTIPDLLRLVPGFSVGQSDETTWAVGSRGFSGIYANKLMVLLDGRSIYMPLFAGVYWDQLNLSLSDIERIEVIRGPGGTIWGANAVNGVVNIITKPADATQGGRASVGAGIDSRGLGEVRYGGRLGERAYYRFSGKYSGRERRYSVNGVDMPIEGTAAVGGGRFDWRNDINHVSIHGSVQSVTGKHIYFAADEAAPRSTLFTMPIDSDDRNAVMSWTRTSSSQRETQVQTSYQQYHRQSGTFLEQWRIVEFDARERRAMGRHHEFVAGVGYRYSGLNTTSSTWLRYEPENEGIHLFTGFIQDEILLSHSIRVTPGTKVEHHHTSGFQAQPSIRVAWNPGTRHTVWGAASRAIRTPSVTDRHIRFTQFVGTDPSGLPIMAEAIGNDAVEPETLRAYEAGYRLQAGHMWVDVTAFTHQYDRLVGGTPGQPGLGFYVGAPVIRVPLNLGNFIAGTGKGMEAAVSWQPAPWWKVTGSSAWLVVDTHTIEQVAQASGVDGAVPKWQFHARTYVDLPGNLEASALYFGTTGVDSLGLESRNALNLRLGWRLGANIDLSGGVQNLFNGGKVEMRDLSNGQVPVAARTAPFAELAWRF